MDVNLVVDSSVVSFGIGEVAKKTIQRQTGFFAFPGMKWYFSWPGRGVIVPIREVQHEEKYDSYTIFFEYGTAMEDVITGQTNWEVNWESSLKEKALQRLRTKQE